MKNEIILNNLDKSLLQKLKSEARQQGMDLNSYILSLIQKALGLGSPSNKDSDLENLDKLSGTWSLDDYNTFITNTESFNTIDDQLWQ